MGHGLEGGGISGNKIQLSKLDGLETLPAQAGVELQSRYASMRPVYRGLHRPGRDLGRAGWADTISHGADAGQLVTRFVFESTG